jgi:predicted nucleotidyltransferase
MKRPQDSDVDLLVESEQGACVGLFEFAGLRRFLSELTGRNVDLVTRRGLHRELRDDILNEAIRAA